MVPAPRKGGGAGEVAVARHAMNGRRRGARDHGGHGKERGASSEWRGQKQAGKTVHFLLGNFMLSGKIENEIE